MARPARRLLNAILPAIAVGSILAACSASAPTDALGNDIGPTPTTEALAFDGASGTEPGEVQVDPSEPSDTTAAVDTTVPAGPRPEVPETPADEPDCRTGEEAAAETEAPEAAVPADVAAAAFATDDVAGCGALVTSTSTVSVQYVLRSATTGEVVDQSWGRAPFDLDLATGGVIEGWLIGLPGMREGGRRTLVIPPELGYGASGSGEAIPPNDTLVFVIDALTVS